MGTISSSGMTARVALAAIMLCSALPARAAETAPPPASAPAPVEAQSAPRHDTSSLREPRPAQKCTAVWNEDERARHYKNLCSLDGKILFALGAAIVARS